MKTTTIHFADHGQDFLRWILNENGIVIQCEPFQGQIWEGCVVLDFQSLMVGDLVRYAHPVCGGVRTIKYRVVEITKETDREIYGYQR